MDRRLELQAVLEEILGPKIDPLTGETVYNVYFQPPATLVMDYDCIRYERAHLETLFADNNPYRLYDRYQLTAIYRNPDSDLPRKIAALPMCSHERHYTADNLNHDVFNLYY